MIIKRKTASKIKKSEPIKLGVAQSDLTNSISKAEIYVMRKALQNNINIKNRTNNRQYIFTTKGSRKHL